MHIPVVIDWIKRASAKADLVLSVCMGAMLLAKVGLLDGLAVTTHYGAIHPHFTRSTLELLSGFPSSILVE
jgi:transcriptional regulator GlxA family with amidase domain